MMMGWGEVMCFKVGFNKAESDCRVRSRVRLMLPLPISERVTLEMRPIFNDDNVI